MPIDMWEHSFTDYIPAKDAKKKYLQNRNEVLRFVYQILTPRHQTQIPSIKINSCQVFL